MCLYLALPSFSSERKTNFLGINRPSIARWRCFVFYVIAILAENLTFVSLYIVERFCVTHSYFQRVQFCYVHLYLISPTIFETQKGGHRNFEGKHWKTLKSMAWPEYTFTPWNKTNWLCTMFKSDKDDCFHYIILRQAGLMTILLNSPKGTLG